MKCVVVSYGSRGDIEPCAVVARELLRRGHDVRVAVPPNMLDLVESQGLEAVAYGPDSHEQLNALPQFMAQMANPYEALPDIVLRVGEIWSDKCAVLASLTEGADVLLTGMNEQRLAANIAEYQRIPLVALHFFPARLQPSGLLHAQITELAEDPQRRALGLPESTGPTPPSLEIQAYDDRCLPAPATQWVEPAAERPFVGPLTLELPADTDEEVLSWIADGTPPIYFGLGSTPVSCPDETVGMAVAACAQLGERLLVCSGPNDFSHLEHFDHVKVVSAVNHAAVFPACRAIVHHGGAGTTAAALRAGVPMLILWLWLDQPVWAAAIEQLKVGVARCFSQTTERTLVADLRSLLAPQYLARAQEIAPQTIAPHESATRAADFVEHAAQH
ncbi:glycosyltransferase [Mycobacterium cookii]|uniref:Putative glycosyltransferase n=1 Tax=Mycobacterium cookii TaxID=1775 RepID=A0A7I7KTB3_9MYCO|nr:glycosyltransferase [Mycobacterium cookii]MCV7331033.1 glycosyltransferase [Mycobacterium cookii]BBX45014.1 putative glycosyltransferase [Mycobacterium cookii]